LRSLKCLIVDNLKTQQSIKYQTIKTLHTMKRRFTILAAAFALLAFLALPMGMRGQTRDVETFTFSELGFGNADDVTTVVGDDVTLTFGQGTNANNAPKYYTSGTAVRMYSGNTLEVALNDQEGETRITAIDFTFVSNSYTGSLQNWTGSETSVSFTNTASGQARIQVIAVTFSEGGTPTPTTYTVTYDCNGGTNGCPGNVTDIEAGTTITLADAPTKTDYTFDGWSDGTTTYQAGASYTVNGNVTFTAQWTEIVSGDEHWVFADLADLTSTDVFVIVGNNGSNYAMSNNNGASAAPSAVAVTVVGNEITSTVASTIKWTISGNATDGYTFYPYGDTEKWLYCTATNNGVRVGVNTANIFKMEASSGYLVHQGTSRYIGIYNSQDWRCYTSASGNIANQTFAFYKKMTGTVPPSISAENVSIEYDAESGTIEYAIHNGVEGGTVSAEVTDGNWLTLGQGTTSPISFTCSANQASAERTATVTLTYTYNRETTTTNVTVTQAGDPNAVNNISDITAAGTYTVQGTIVAKSQRGFIVGDGTGYVYYYNQSYTQADYNTGDMVKLTGPVVVYGGVFEFNSSTTITAATSSNYVAEDPTVITGEQMDTRVGSTTPPQLSSYVQYEGTMTVNDGHYNITNIIGATTAIGSISYPLNVDEITALDGKHVKVTGYYVGISTGTYYNTMLGSIEEIASSDPSITAEDVSIEYNATTGAIEYTINNPVDGGVLTAATESEWLTLGAVGTTVPFTCTANTTASPRTATVTLTYTYNTDQVVTKNVTVTQAGNPNTIDNISDITEAGNYTVQGTIVAISNRGFILGDGTGYVYYYHGSSGFEPGDYDIGDIVKLAGSVIVYGGVYEFNNSTTITYVEESNYEAEEPTVLSGSDMDARVASTTPPQLSSYVQYEGTLSVNGNYYNITNIEGATTAIGSISYPLNGDEITALDGKQVKVTGYYVGISTGTYYNTLLGSIEEVEVQHEQYTLTVSNLVNVNTFVFDAANQNEMLLEGEGSVQIYNGTGVIISVDVEEGYALQSLMVDGVDVTSQIDGTGAYTFTMPTHNVTVTATAIEYVAGNYVRINSLNQLTDGSKVIIAARYNEENTNGYYAMPGVTSGKPDGVAFTSLISGNDEILPATITSSENTYYWTVNVTENGYTFTNADGQMIGYSSGTNFATNNNTEWTIALETAGNSAMVAEYTGFVIRNGNTDTRAFAFNGTAFGAYSTTNINAPGYNFYLDFFVQPAGSETVTQTTNLVTGWNWFSTYIEVDDPVDMLQAIEASLGENGIIIKNSDGYSENDPDWGWFGDLDEEGIVNEQMYKILVSGPCTVTLAGTPANPEEHAITINQGWNWIGFPSSVAMSLEDALAGFAQDGDIIRNSDGEISYDADWEMWSDDMTLEPGQGYAYYSASSTPRRLVFNTGAKAK
jgi:uncharacterized repeat protein (TIGR02543 family)